MFSLKSLLGVALAAAVAAGCGGISSPSENTVQTYSGTFAVGSGAAPMAFSASKNGEFFVTPTALAPDSTAFFGVSIGVQSGTSCSPIPALTNPTSQVNRQVLGGPLDKGNYCIFAYDSGFSTLSGPQTFTIRVSFP